MLIAAWETHRRFTFSFPRATKATCLLCGDCRIRQCLGNVCSEGISLGNDQEGILTIAQVPFLAQVDVDTQFNASLLEQRNVVAISPGSLHASRGALTSLTLQPSHSVLLRNLSCALCLLPPLQHARMDVCLGFGTLNGEFSLTALTHIPGGGRNKGARSLASDVPAPSYDLKREPSAAAAAFRQQR